MLRIEMNYPYADIATALGKPSIAAAQMAVSRALVRLAEEMATWKSLTRHDSSRSRPPISDGVAVDWAHLPTPQAPSQATAVLREMAVLERIAQFHRKDDRIRNADRRAPRPARPRRSNTRCGGTFACSKRSAKARFGAVYRARDTKLDSEVALKLPQLRL